MLFPSGQHVSETHLHICPYGSVGSSLLLSRHCWLFSIQRAPGLTPHNPLQPVHSLKCYTLGIQLWLLIPVQFLRINKKQVLSHMSLSSYESSLKKVKIFLGSFSNYVLDSFNPLAILSSLFQQKSGLQHKSGLVECLHSGVASSRGKHLHTASLGYSPGD